MVALVNGIQPQALSVKEILNAFIEHRKEVIRRRAEFDLKKAEERAHILMGLFKALGDMGLNWKDVQILNDKDGKPLCVIRNGKNKKLDVHISISHVKNYAVANAIITQKP